jgi:hypothetical protein
MPAMLGGARAVLAARFGWIVGSSPRILPSLGVRTRGLNIAVNAKRQVADASARAEAKAVIDRWNEHLAASRDMLWSPTIRAALIAGRLGSMCSAQAAVQAGRWICGKSTAIPSRRSQRWCSGCGARGARKRPRWQGFSGCMPCRLPRRLRGRICTGEPSDAASARPFPQRLRPCRGRAGTLIC